MPGNLPFRQTSSGFAPCQYGNYRVGLALTTTSKSCTLRLCRLYSLASSWALWATWALPGWVAACSDPMRRPPKQPGCQGNLQFKGGSLQDTCFGHTLLVTALQKRAVWYGHTQTLWPASYRPQASRSSSPTPAWRMSFASFFIMNASALACHCLAPRESPWKRPLAALDVAGTAGCALAAILAVATDELRLTDRATQRYGAQGLQASGKVAQRRDRWLTSVLARSTPAGWAAFACLLATA